jgi:Family of unknown function (DUF6527)
MDIQGHLVEGYDQAKNPGDFWWSQTRLTFRCPCGCGDVGGIAVEKDMDDRDGNHPIWKWDGNKELPTIVPSIRFMSGCKWHGNLIEGIFKKANG